MALKYANNEVAEDFLQNENLQSKSYTIAHSSNMRTYKNNSSSIKYGLSELSNDKTYLETELPARKRLKPETELINSTKYLNKTCRAVVNGGDDSDNALNEGKYSSEIYYILSSEQVFENNPPSNQLLRSNLNSEINTQSESSVLKSGTCNSVFQSNILDNHLKSDSKQCKRELKIHDIELNSENDLCKNIDNDKISNQGTESETDFDDEVNKCYELLNLDVPKIAVVSTTVTKIASNNSGNNMIENSDFHKLSNHNNKSLDSLYPQSTELVTNLETMSNNVNLATICLDKKSKNQDDLLNKKEKNCKDNIEFKDESNSLLYTIVTSNSFLRTCNENCNFNHKFIHNDINLGTEHNSLDSEFKDKDKNSTLKLNNILHVNDTSIRVPNTFIPETIQNNDSKNNTEHLNLTIENTFNSDRLKLKGRNQNILPDHSNGYRDEIGDTPSTVDDSGDILSLYYESDFDFYPSEEEIHMTNLSESESPILEGTSKSNMSVFHASPDNDNNPCKYAGNDVKNIDNSTWNEKIDPVDVSHTLGDKNYELHVSKGISNNDSGENNNDFDIKVNESFVSEYEISLLIEDTDSILSEESLDSEYEISLLEGDTDDEESKNDLLENNSNSFVNSGCLPNNNEKDGKIEAIPQEYIKEQENEQTTNNVNIFEKETDKVISKNKIYPKSISKENIASSTKEIIPPNSQKNNVANKTDFDVKKSAPKEIQTFSNIESNEYTSVKPEPDIGGKIIQKFQTSATLRCEKADDIKKEPSKNTNDSYFPLKPEINNESQTKSEEILNCNKLKNSEEKTFIVDTNKHLAGRACINVASIAKFVKTELDITDIDELTQNVTDGLQSSNKVVYNSKMNDTKKPEEKVPVVKTHKQFTECTYTDKAICENLVKTDLGVSASSESKQDVKDIIPDYYEEEKEDLINPGWNKIKELSTDEERYQQVRDCWKSKNIPDPFKNLTYYSYRKRNIDRREDDTHQIRQHKRHASSNLNDKNVKRSRSCTYIFDDRIKSIDKDKEMKVKTIHDKMFDEVSRLNEQQQQEEMGIQNFYGFGFHPRRQYDLCDLRREYEQRVSDVTVQYEQKVNNCYDQYATEINKLKSNRNEVLQFYSFYKGLNTDRYKDPTILTNTQMQELEEIENIYNKMDIHYR